MSEPCSIEVTHQYTDQLSLPGCLVRYCCPVSETRETQFEEMGEGYTFFCIGKPEDDMRTSGVGFAIRTLKSLPRSISDRLMALRSRIAKDQ